MKGHHHAVPQIQIDDHQVVKKRHHKVQPSHKLKLQLTQKLQLMLKHTPQLRLKRKQEEKRNHHMPLTLGQRQMTKNMKNEEKHKESENKKNEKKEMTMKQTNEIGKNEKHARDNCDQCFKHK